MRPTPSADRLLYDPFFARLKNHLIEATGLAYYAEKDLDLARKIAERLGKLQLVDCASYLARLTDPQQGQTELDIVIEALTIGETFFFRHREMFDALRDVVLPDVIARNQQQRQLHIWSAGCSIGAEPYSLSLLLKREMAAQLQDWETSIIGTDINRDFLARAREGIFEEWAFRATPEPVRAACFVPVGNRWQLAPQFRRHVSFQYHNLVTHPFPSLLNNLSAFDVILCRNVTIYFSQPIVQRLVNQFHQCLTPDGWLLVGHAEPNLELFRAFRTVNAPGVVLYQKSDAAGIKSTTAPLDFFSSWQQPSLPSTPLYSPPQFVSDPWPESPPLPAPSAQSLSTEIDGIRSLADRGEWQKAVGRCQILARDSLTPAIYFYQALVLEQLGRHDEAEVSLRPVLYLDRSSVLGHYYLGLLLQRTRKPGQARRSFRNALDLLERVPADRVYVEGDNISACELTKLTQMHLEVLEGHGQRANGN